LKAEGLIGEKVVATHIVAHPSANENWSWKQTSAAASLTGRRLDLASRLRKSLRSARTVCPHADDQIGFAVEAKARVVAT